MRLRLAVGAALMVSFVTPGLAQAGPAQPTLTGAGPFNTQSASSLTAARRALASRASVPAGRYGVGRKPAGVRSDTAPDSWNFVDDGTANGPQPASLCGQSGCPKLAYDPGGQVQYDGTHAYNIFWQPYGSGWATFRQFMNNFYNGISNSGLGTGYYGDLTQYYQTDVSGGSKHYIANYSVFKGSWVDTQAYPTHSGQRYLDNSDAKSEVARAISKAGWPAAFGNQYNIIVGVNGTGAKENICNLGVCYDANGLCAWHSYTTVDNTTVPFTVIGYGPSTHCWPNHCPNDTTGQCNVDGTMNVMSHETFETETDPVVQHSWYLHTSPGFGDEVADVCEHNWDAETYDGGRANHYWNGTYYDLVDEYDLAEYNTPGVYGCVPYGPRYP